jgi:DNA-binding NarL/FixJ family response regulator
MGGPPMVASTARVMVVAGHPVIHGVVRLACERVDVEFVGGTSSGPGAFAPLDRDVDILVVDLDPPGGDGIEALRQLREEGFLGRVVVLSDRADGSTVLRVLRLGVDAYLTKSDGLRDLASTIQKVVEGERVIPSNLERAAVSELGRFARRARDGAAMRSALTRREVQVLEQLAEGLTMQQIGRRLGISARTVETHVSNLYRKLEVRSRVQAVSRAAACGLIDLR